jgi:tetratricopeptide (TPR) repeat protein
MFSLVYVFWLQDCYKILTCPPPASKDRAKIILQGDPGNAGAQMLLSNADLALGNLPDALKEAEAAVSMAPDKPSSYLNLGQIEFRAGNLSGAEASFLKAQSVDPKSTLAYMTLGSFYQQQKRWPDAEKQFQTAIEVAPKDSVSRAALARLYFAQGQVAQAEKVLTDAKEQLSDQPAAYRMLGDTYLARGDIAKAIAEFGALAAKYPNDLQVRRTYIQLLIMNNRLDEAEKLTADVLKKSSQDAEALVLKGQIQVKQKKTDEAITTLQSAIKLSPENALAHYQLGLAYGDKGNTQQAEGEWREAVRLRPGLTEAWIALGSSAAQRSDWRNLEDISNELKKHSTNSVEALLDHATARFNQGDIPGAEADLLRVQQLAPNSPLPYVKLGDLRLRQRKLVEAELFYRQALTQDASSLEAIRGIVQVNLAKGKPADALKVVNDQLQRNQNSAGLYLLQGELLLQTKQPDLAYVAFSHSVQLDGKNPAALTRLAQLQASKGQSQESIGHYQNAIALLPRDIALYVALGGLYDSLGNWQEAQNTYQKALAIQPDNPIVSNNLAYLLLEHGGSVNVALTLAQTGRKGLPELPNSGDTLGWAYYNNGAYSLAAPLFEDAVKKVPGNQVYRYHLGMAYKKLNDSPRAKIELQKAIDLSPTTPVAGKSRQALSELTGS